MSDKIVEAINFQGVKKGNILARCDVYVKPWDLDFLGVTVCEKGANRWVQMPSHKFEGRNGETKYQELCRFRNLDKHRRFLAQVNAEVMEKFKEWHERNPNMEMEPAITEMDDCPF
jgi:hypothetical protein